MLAASLREDQAIYLWLQLKDVPEPRARTACPGIAISPSSSRPRSARRRRARPRCRCACRSRLHWMIVSRKFYAMPHPADAQQGPCSATGADLRPSGQARHLSAAGMPHRRHRCILLQGRPSDRAVRRRCAGGADATAPSVPPPRARTVRPSAARPRSRLEHSRRSAGASTCRCTSGLSALDLVTASAVKPRTIRSHGCELPPAAPTEPEARHDIRRLRPISRRLAAASSLTSGKRRAPLHPLLAGGIVAFGRRLDERRTALSALPEARGLPLTPRRSPSRSPG